MASAPTGKKSSVRSFLETWGAAIAAILGGATFFALIFPSTAAYSRGHDFLALYTGGYLVRTAPAQLYDMDAQSKVQYQVAPDIPVVTPFPRPAFSALFYYPIACLPLNTAFTIWIGLGIAALFAIWAWAARRFGPEILVYCAFFVPLLFGIATGQDTLLVSGILILAYCALERGKPALGGALLALLLAKFNLTFLVLPVLLIRREWRILAGYAPTALVAVAVSVALASPASYVALLRNPKLEALHTSPQMMVNTNAIALNLGLDFPVVRILLIAAVLAMVFSIPRTASLERWLFAAICGSMLISPHTFEYDVAMLLVPILKILSDAAAAPLLRGIAATAAIPLPYFLTTLPKPYSGTPALLIFVLFLAIAWPQWFSWRPWPLAYRPGRA